MFQKRKISAIISAFNEGKLIKSVIKCVLNCRFIDEIIVVDDGSTDNTFQILREFSGSRKLKFIRFKKNKGKSYAMVKGVENSKGSVLLFLDADFIGLKNKHIKQLLTPLLKGSADMVIGHPTEGKLDKNLNPSKFIAGQRAVFKKDIKGILRKIKTTGYGVETMLNLYYKSLNKKAKIVYLWGLIHPIKFEKEKLPHALKNYLKAGFHILKTVAANYSLIIVILNNTFNPKI